VPSPISSGGVAVESFDGEVGHEAVAAEDAHRVQRDFCTGFRGEELGHAGFDVASFAGVFFAGGMATSRRAASTRVAMSGKEQLDCLMLADWFAEGGALLRVADCGFEGGLPYSTARAATLMRPTSSALITCLKPVPSAPPIRLVAGTDTSSKRTSQVSMPL